MKATASLEGAVEPAAAKPKKLPAVAIDLDEVLGAFVPQVALFHNERYGTSLTADHFFSYDFGAVWGGGRADADAKVAAFFESRHFRGEAGEGIPVLEGARNVLEKYVGRLEFHLVTSRQHAIEPETRAWISRHFPGTFSSLQFGNHWAAAGTGRKRSKPDMCAAVGAVLLVDDSLQYAQECAAAGMRVALHGRYAWNGGCPPASASAFGGGSGGGISGGDGCGGGKGDDGGGSSSTGGGGGGASVVGGGAAGHGGGAELELAPNIVRTETWADVDRLLAGLALPLDAGDTTDSGSQNISFGENDRMVAAMGEGAARATVDAAEAERVNAAGKRRRKEDSGGGANGSGKSGGDGGGDDTGSVDDDESREGAAAAAAAVAEHVAVGKSHVISVSAAKPVTFFAELARAALHEGGAESVTLRALGKAIVVAVDTAQRLERNGWAKRARVESSIATTVAATATATAAVTAAADYLPPGETAESCAAAATGKTCLSVVMVKA